MPVAFVRNDSAGARVPVADTPFWIGRDAGCQLVVPGAAVGERHARLRYLKGEYVLTAAEGCRIWVNGQRVPVMPLRDGDVLALVDPAEGDAPTLRFRNRIEDAFIPPGASMTQAWLNHAGSRDASHGPQGYGAGEPLGGRPPERIRQVTDDGGDAIVVKVAGACRTPEEGDRFRSVLAALAGAPHPALAPVVDGGVAFVEDEAVRWMATRYVEGRTAREILADAGMEPTAVLPLLRTVAGGLERMHSRGVVHRDISPGNVVRRPDGTGVIIDFGTAFLLSAGAPPSGGIIGTPGFLAPEEVLEGGEGVTTAVDVYGLGAVAYALLTGSPPAQGDDVLEILSGALAPPPSLREMGLTLPDALEGVILSALEPAPAARPSIDGFMRAIAFAEAQLGL